METTFATAINCIDGRVQIPVIDWMKKEYAVQYVDMITEPGPNKILAENTDEAKLESIRRRLEISVANHNSKVVAIAGHYDCAGNPVDIECQLKHIFTAIQVVKEWNMGIKVVGLWVGENWQVGAVA